MENEKNIENKEPKKPEEPKDDKLAKIQAKLDKIIEERQKIEAENNKLKDEMKEAETKKLEEQEKFKELYESAKSELEEKDKVNKELTDFKTQTEEKIEAERVKLLEAYSEKMKYDDSEKEAIKGLTLDALKVLAKAEPVKQNSPGEKGQPEPSKSTAPTNFDDELTSLINNSPIIKRN